jgi:hypothetical protein
MVEPSAVTANATKFAVVRLGRREGAEVVLADDAARRLAER